MFIFSLWRRQFTRIQFVFNVYIACCEFYYLIDIISFIIRFQDGRYILLSLFGWKHGCKVKWVTDIDVAKQVLLNSVDKGSFLEEKLFAPAWLPVLSLESVNGKAWNDLKSKFIIFQKHLPPVENLVAAARHILSTQDPNIEIDAKEVVRITVACFIKWIFNLDWDIKWNFVCEASWEWRKEIAAKGRGNIQIKHQTIEWLINLINHSEYYRLFGEQWSNPEYYSIIMQPFILSPMINISDVAVSAYRHPGMSIQEFIHYYHPFPIMERYIEKDFVKHNNNGDPIILIKGNTQVFIPLDTIGQCEQYRSSLWTPFGIGPRKCQGSQYALPLLTELMSYYKDNPQFMPGKNHRYSGRNNDHLSFSESIYQLILFIKVFIRN
ncbi:unnamed protein product [Adineta ricciae]|uniref:Cytochrome P450 n=1 Tax=Adineta ricciae TaxID=249248 RepID=A0A813V019_ADIRI|nr:unnamed protein product [Adineta ricciae]CAF1499659.1 unnamed protein product [Adineta ricciae]